MRMFILSIMLFNVFISNAHADCDMTQFRWECDINMHLTPTSTAHSLVYCGDTMGYVTEAQYDLLARYQLADIDMNLDLDRDYVDSPCVAMHR